MRLTTHLLLITAGCALAATTATVERLTASDNEVLNGALERGQASIQHLQHLVRDLLGRLRPPGGGFGLRLSIPARALETAP